MLRRQERLPRILLVGIWLLVLSSRAEAVVPVIVGPLQALLAILPSLLVALGGVLLAVFRPSGAKKLLRFLWHQKAFTAILIAAIAGVVLASRHDWGRAATAASELRAGTHWLAFRGGLARRGAVPDSPEPTLAEPVWDFRDDAGTIYSSPAVVGNRVYVTTADKGVFTDRGAILCLDAETGAEVWRYAPDGFRATFSSPAVNGRYVVCGEGLHYTDDARITCLDLEGNRLWELSTRSHVESSPCISDGRVYIGAGDDGYYCIELDPGPDGQPTVVWHLSGERYKDCETSPAVADGVVYFGLGMAGNAVCAADAETGRELWRIEAPYPVFGPPTLADGRLYVGMGNGNFIETAEQVRANVVRRMREAGRPEHEIAEAEKRLGPIGELWCIDPKTAEVEWRYRTARTVLGAVAAADGRLYFGSRDGHVHCVSTQGKLVREWNARDPIMTSPALGKDHVYVATVSGRLHCLRADTLEPVWDVRLGNGSNFLSSPALALGHIYIGTEHDGLRCIGRVGERPPPLWTDGARGGADRSPLPERGALAWRYPRDNPEQFRVTAPMMMLDEALYVPSAMAGQAGLVKLKLGREIRDDAERVLWMKLLPRPIVMAPGGVGNHVYVVSGEPPSPGLMLHCLDADDGTERWRLPLAPQASGQFALSRRHLYVWTGPGTLACLPVGTDERPELLWSKRLGRGAVPPAPGKGILVVATARGLLALDDGTGTVLWKVALAEPPLSAPLRLPRAVVLTTGKVLALHRIVDGSVAWMGLEDCGAVPAFLSPAVADADRVAAVTAATKLAVYRTSDGERLPRPYPAWSRPPVLRLPHGVLFAFNDIQFLGDDAEAPRQWARTGWLGRFLTPLILFDSHIYSATDKRGVVCLGPRQR